MNLAGGHSEIPRMIVERMQGKNPKFAIGTIKNVSENERYHPVEVFNVLLGLFTTNGVADSIKIAASDALVNLLKTRLKPTAKMWISQGLGGRLKSPMHARTLCKLLLDPQVDENVHMAALRGLSKYAERDDATKELRMTQEIEDALNESYRRRKTNSRFTKETEKLFRRGNRPALNIAPVDTGKRKVESPKAGAPKLARTSIPLRKRRA